MPSRQGRALKRRQAQRLLTEMRRVYEWAGGDKQPGTRVARCTHCEARRSEETTSTKSGQCTVLNKPQLARIRASPPIVQVFEFLDLPVPEPSSPLWPIIEAAGPRVTYTSEAGWVIPEGARRVLSKMYERHNEELAELLGDRSWLSWNEDKLVCPPSC